MTITDEFAMIIVHFLIFLLFLQKYFVECEKCSTFAR
jgi:hypothetical protein